MIPQIKKILFSYKNYIATTICTLCIYSWYLNADLICMHDGPFHIKIMHMSYQAFRSGKIPMWYNPTGPDTALGMAAIFNFGVVPSISIAAVTASVLPFVLWYKMHILLLTLFGQFGIIAYLKNRGVSSMLSSVAAVIALMSGCTMAHTMLFANFWIVNVSFLPWIMLCTDKKQWKSISLLIAAMVFNGPLHMIVMVPAFCGLYVLLSQWRSVANYVMATTIGMVLSSFVIVPVLCNSFLGTVGRASSNIQNGFFSCHEMWVSFCGRFNQLTFWQISECSFPVMWMMYYCYIGIIPFLLIAFAIFVGVKSYRNRHLFACSIIAAIVFACCCGNTWIYVSHIPIVNQLAKINIVPTRMLPLFLIFGSCSLAMVLNEAKHVCANALICALLLWVTIDYTLLLRDLEDRGPLQIKKEDRANVSNFQKFIAPPLRFACKSFGGEHCETPIGENSLFIGNTEELKLVLVDTDAVFADRFLRLNSAKSGLSLRAKNGTFTIPPSNGDIYQVRYYDKAMVAGAIISITAFACLLWSCHRESRSQNKRKT